MRLKEDSGSWKASGIKRKDQRHRKDVPEVEKPKSTVKNTRKWCAGKVGVKHIPVWEKEKTRHTWMANYEWWDERCKKCGKKFDWWSSGVLLGRKQQMPESLKKQLEEEGKK